MVTKIGKSFSLKINADFSGSG